MNNTKIEWCDSVWNVVTGCSKVSSGCKNCYAETIARRFWGDRKFSDVKLHSERLEQPSKLKKPSRIFVNSMSDLFHKDVPFDFIDKVFDTMILNHRHTYLILTKRPERMLEYVKSRKIFNDNTFNHIWMGISVENQETAYERIPYLLQVPFGKRFLSCEPLLGEIPRLANIVASNILQGKDSYGINWVIAGGESGHNARPMNPKWVRSIRDQCKEANIPFFFKQWGEWAIREQVENYQNVEKLHFCKKCHEWDDGHVSYRIGKNTSGRLLDGREWNEFPKGEK